MVIRGRRKLPWMDTKEVESLRGEVDEARLTGRALSASAVLGPSVLLYADVS